MSSNQMPPWLQEQIVKMQQAQKSLQSVMAQRQHLELEKIEVSKALEELGKISDDVPVYKHAGAVLIKTDRQKMIEDLEERQTMSTTRNTVLEKQESRIKESIKEQEAKITEMMKSGNTSTTSDSSVDNPRK